MKSISIFILLFAISHSIHSQEIGTNDSKLPYSMIDGYPDNFESGNIIKRMIDGLGYRYYWATDSLRNEDLDFKPGETNRTSRETLEHLYNLSGFILNSAANKPNIRPRPENNDTWEEMRSKTLNNLYTAADQFSKKSSKDIETTTLDFQRGDNSSSVSFWHLLNGPLADALYHVGQIVSNRRASGNPLDPRVNVFMGKNR
ncbi:MAG: hypothetical protein HKN51_11415 [Saprospiraceae bacterium]|nr:hypothetical protein [Saprospiraceae bacterium]